MKPSFLRKQKYTVQECHNRGRKNLRKGLKFHNFLPSESVTSEQDNGFLNTKWKVHSECRLREEHGTKQITISNWSQSVQNLPNESTNYRVKTTLPSSSLSTPETNSTEQSLLKFEDQSILDCKSKSVTNDPYDFNLNSQQHSPPESENIHLKLNRVNSDMVQNSLAYPSSKKDSLNYVLNSLMEKPLSSEKKSTATDDSDIHHKSYQKHRRKPVQTRRIVPYVKYLSIMEENDSLPLDLSSKCLIENSSRSSVSSGDDVQSITGINDTDFVKISPVTSCDNSEKYTNENISLNDKACVPHISSDKSVKGPSDSTAQTQIAAPVAVLYPLSFDKKSKLGQNGFYSATFQESNNLKAQLNTNPSISNTFAVSVDKSYASQSVSNNSTFSVQKSFVKEVQAKPRRRNQRSAIKQKLEDTFRQNGFLVKTKQVSDGEATFCKFRQLRKYTRYYLKSLEQHLPDEFHKMWKGFLPPKTVLPPVVGTLDPSCDSPS